MEQLTLEQNNLPIDNSTTNTNNLTNNSGAVVNGDNKGLMVFANINSKETKLRIILNKMLQFETLDIIEDDLSKYDTEEYTIEGKIDYNCLADKWLEIIYDYPAYEHTIEESLKEDIDGSSKKSKFLYTLQSMYRNVKKKLNIPLKCQKSICEHSEAILDLMKEKIIDLLKINNEPIEIYDELSIEMLVAFGFIECKILEKPIKAL